MNMGCRGNAKSNILLSKMIQENEIKICDNCDNCIYVGEGGFLCDELMCMVMDDFEPTDEFYACGGSEWVSKDDDEEEV